MTINAMNHEVAFAPNGAFPAGRSATPVDGADEDERPAFAAVMAHQLDRNGGENRDEAAERKAEAREAANQLVASTFIIPILGKLRDSSMAEGPFAPGAAEKRFGPMLDQHMADRIIEASNFDIVDAIAERYAGMSDRVGGDRREAFEQFERVA